MFDIQALCVRFAAGKTENDGREHHGNRRKKLQDKAAVFTRKEMEKKTGKRIVDGEEQDTDTGTPNEAKLGSGLHPERSPGVEEAVGGQCPLLGRNRFLGLLANHLVG